MLEIQSSSRGQHIYFVLKKYQQVSAIFTDIDTTSRYHKNRLIPPIPILKYRYITTKKQVEEMEVRDENVEVCCGSDKKRQD